MPITDQHAGAVLTIDLDTIRQNYALLRIRSGRAACAAVVKADAYGLGATRVAPVLAEQGCRHFFVAHIDEAIALRPHLPEHAEIFVLHGPPIGTDVEFIHHRLIVGAVSMDTCTIDVTDASPDSLFPGALVDLISTDQPVDAVAILAGTIGYEILTSLGKRYHREYAGDQLQHMRQRVGKPPGALPI